MTRRDAGGLSRSCATSVPEPAPRPGPGQVLVRVVAYAPYGTDVGVYLNRHGRYVAEYPVGVGADFSGTVDAIGEGVDGLALAT